MDKRILKTKNNLKQTLLRMMEEKPFEKIGVTELCRRAQTSRITFYTYYGDKYELLQELYQDMQDEMEVRFCELQKENNPFDEAFKSYHNLVQAVIEKYDTHMDFYKHMKPVESQELWKTYYAFALKHLEEFKDNYSDRIRMKHPSRQICVSLLLGFWGFLITGYSEGMPSKEIEENALSLIDDMIGSGVYFEKAGKSSPSTPVQKKSVPDVP